MREFEKIETAIFFLPQQYRRGSDSKLSWISRE